MFTSVRVWQWFLRRKSTDRYCCSIGCFDRVVVQTKPGDNPWAFENWWTYRLHNCCEDSGTCKSNEIELSAEHTGVFRLWPGCLTCCCCPCTMRNIYRRADEDLLSCCWPMTFCLLRTKIRTLFRIRVSAELVLLFSRNYLSAKLGFDVHGLSIDLLLSDVFDCSNASGIVATRLVINERVRQRVTYILYNN